MALKEYWLNTINEKAKPSFIYQSLILGWTVLIGSLIVDIMFPNQTFWLQRSGAVLCMLSIAAEFRLNQLDRSALIDDWNARCNDEKAIDTPMFIETNREKSLKLIAHFSVAVGTLVWAYCDLPFKENITS